jgi:PAS domain S-box-containing protein
MRDSKKTKAQLVDELTALRQRVAQMEAAETELEQVVKPPGASEREFRGLVNNALVGIYRTNLEGDILYANEFLSSMMGFESPQEMMETGVLNRYRNPKDRETLLWRLEKEGQVSGFDVELLDKSGGTVAVLLSAALEGDVLTGMIMDITERVRVEDSLRHRLGMEELVAAISTHFINLSPEQTDSEIGQALQSIGEFVGVDRSYFGLYDSNATQVQQEYEWFAQGLAPQSDRFQGMVVAPLRWSREKYRRADIVSVSQVAGLPPEASAEKALWQALGAKSILTIPLFRGQALVGYLGFQAERDERSWSDDDTILLKLAGEIFLNALDRRQAEGALRESEERLRGLFETMAEGIVLISPAGQIVQANRAAEKILGLKHSEIEGRDYVALDWDIVRPDGTPMPPDEMAGPRAMKENRPVKDVEMGVRRPDGSTSWINVSAAPLINEAGALEGVVGTFAEITERKQLELEVEERRLYLESVLSCAPDVIITLDAQQRLLEWNAGAERLFGYTPEEARGRRIDELITGCDPRAMEEANRLTQQTLRGESVSSVETVRYHKDGSPVHVILSGSPILIEDRVVGGIGVYSEITERKRAEAALRQSEFRYRGLFEQSPVSLWEEDASAVKKYIDDLRKSRVSDFTTYFQDHPEAVAHCASLVKVLDVNQATLNLFKASSKQDLKKGILTVVGEPWASGFQDELVALAEGSTHFEREAALRSVGGETIHAVLSVAVVPGCEETWSKMLVSMVDLTDHKRLQEKLLMARKMEAVGQLAGGIAHDFNNLLTSINGFSELILYRLPADDPVYDMTGKILRSGQRAADLVSQLLAFSRKQMIAPQRVNLNHVVANMDETLKPIVGPDVELATILAPDLGSVKVDPKQFEGVIRDLAANARRAMPEGGKLTIETANVVLGQEEISEHVEVPEGDYVLLAVSDTGAGLSDEARDRIFEPFFITSQDVANGIGLRLAAVYGIVKQNDGYIWAESQAGQGTTFKIYLPRASTEVTLAPSPNGAA